MPLMKPPRDYGAWASGICAGVLAISGAMALSANGSTELTASVEESASAAMRKAQAAPQPPSALLPAPPAARLAAVSPEVLTRPLFTPSRRPSTSAVSTTQQAVEAMETAAVRAPPDALKLVGTVTTRKRQRALIRAAGKQASAWLQSGDQFEGWTVESITAGSVVLSSQEGQRRIELYPKPAAGSDRSNPESR